MMTITLFLTAAVLTAGMGLYEAYSRKRGVLGWVVSILASAVGGIAAGTALGLAVAGLVNPDTVGREAHLALGLASIVVGLIAGSSIMLWIVNRFR